MEKLQERRINSKLNDQAIVCEHDWPVESSECILCFHQKLIVEAETYEQEEKRIWGGGLRLISNEHGK